MCVLHQCHLDTLSMGNAYCLHPRYRERKLGRTALHPNMCHSYRALKTNLGLRIVVVLVANCRRNQALTECVQGRLLLTSVAELGDVHLNLFFAELQM